MSGRRYVTAPYQITGPEGSVWAAWINGEHIRSTNFRALSERCHEARRENQRDAKRRRVARSALLAKPAEPVEFVTEDGATHLLPGVRQICSWCRGDGTDHRSGGPACLVCDGSGVVTAVDTDHCPADLLRAYNAALEVIRETVGHAG